MPLLIRLNADDVITFRGKRVKNIRATQDGKRYILRTKRSYLCTVAPGEVPGVDMAVARWRDERRAARKAAVNQLHKDMARSGGPVPQKEDER